MALPASIAAPVEALARCTFLRMEAIDGNLRWSPNMESRVAAREAEAMLRLPPALAAATPPMLRKATAMPAPRGVIDDSVAAALGVPSAAEFHTTVFAGVPAAAGPFKQALAGALPMWPGLADAKAKFDAAFAAHLSAAGVECDARLVALAHGRQFHKRALGFHLPRLRSNSCTQKSGPWTF